MQASLVEVLPAQIGVEVTLTPGIDIAPKVVAQLDTNGDGIFSEAESAAWSAQFMAAQSVAADGKSLPLKIASFRTSPLAEMTGGHAEIVVHFTAALDQPARTIVCTNRYEPMPCAYQTNGLVPKQPGVRIASHRRDERQQSLTLAAEFSSPAAPATSPAQSAKPIPQNRPAISIPWLIGMSIAGATAAAMVERRRRPAKSHL